MVGKFKNIYLVCLDHGDDLNYVVARNPSIKKARLAADRAKQKWPDKEVYITVEKLLDEPPIEEARLPRQQISNRCKCGAGEGDCVSNLSCKCPAIAKCKQMKVYDPFAPDFSTDPDSSLEPTEINVINIRRGIIEIIIPDWDPDETIGLSPNEIPSDVMDELEPGVVLEADINLDARSAEDLILNNLRLVFEDVEDDEENNQESTESHISYSSLNFNNYPELSVSNRNSDNDQDDSDHDSDQDDENYQDDEDYDEDYDENDDFLDEESEESTSFNE